MHYPRINKSRFVFPFVLVLLGLYSSPVKAFVITSQQINTTAALTSAGNILNSLQYFGELPSPLNSSIQGNFNSEGFTITVASIDSPTQLNFTTTGTTTASNNGNSYTTSMTGTGFFGSQQMTTTSFLETVYDLANDKYIGSLNETGSRNPVWLWVVAIFFLSATTLGDGEIQSQQPVPPPPTPIPPSRSDLSITSDAFNYGPTTSSGQIIIKDGLISGNLITQPVPGPLPILGLGAVFGYSRKLRKRFKSSKPEVISTTAV